MGKSAGDKIADSEAGRHHQTPPAAAALRAPPDCPPTLTVRLDKGGRHFGCPCCGRTHRHPPDNPEFYMIGYGVCELYARWMPIEGGDDLGVVRVGEDGRRYTVEHGARGKG